MKNEMFYGRSWQGVTLENFMQQIESYMVWYRDTRIKLSLGGLSPAEFRTKMGITIQSNKMSAPPTNYLIYYIETTIS